jgi:hypothetical protein
VPRELTDREREVLEVLVARAAAAGPNRASQLAQLRVVGTCGCGCPTIHFGHQDPSKGIEVVADVAVRETNDAILLFVSEHGFLDSLEYVWVGDDIPAEFPPPNLLGSSHA